MTAEFMGPGSVGTARPPVAGAQGLAASMPPGAAGPAPAAGAAATGLSSAEAVDRLRRDGPNALPAARPPSPALLLLLGIPPLARLLGGAPPSALGWLLAAAAVPAVLAADTGYKLLRGRLAR